jgi:hypothetical protein
MWTKRISCASFGGRHDDDSSGILFGPSDELGRIAGAAGLGDQVHGLGPFVGMSSEMISARSPVR